MDHYTLLGIHKSAGPEEIKRAFRELAKKHHPDKNPNDLKSAEFFRQVLLAYETLSDPERKKRYDSLINFNVTYFAAKTQDNTDNKKRDITEQELKRRQYYQQYYQKYKKQSQTINTGKRYNETKYILISIPIALLLLWLIVSRFGDKKSVPAKPSVLKTEKANLPAKKTGTSDTPYQAVLGDGMIDRSIKQVVQFNNWSGKDAIVFLRNKETQKIDRHYFVGNNYLLLVEYLPAADYDLLMYLGEQFESEMIEQPSGIKGRFLKSEQFQHFQNPSIRIKKENTDTMLINIVPLEIGDKKLVSKSTFFSWIKS